MKYISGEISESNSRKCDYPSEMVFYVISTKSLSTSVKIIVLYATILKYILNEIREWHIKDIRIFVITISVTIFLN